MILPTIALFSVIALFLNSENSSQKTEQPILNNDSIKKEKSVVILDSGTKLKSSIPILDLKDSTLNLKKQEKTNIDNLKSPKNDLKANSVAAKHLMNDTINRIITYTVTSNVQEKIFSINEVEVKPEFPNGINKFHAFIWGKFKRPKDCPEGRIAVTFVIEKDGSLTDIKTVKDIGFGVGEEVIRVLKECPKWIPGKNDEKIVRVQYTLALTIQAEEELYNYEPEPVYSLAGIEQKPEFIGGMEKLYAFIAKNYKTPIGCPSGKVYMTFIVEQDGSLSNIKCVKDVGFGSGKEAVRVLQECPNWIPGEQNGKKVRVLYSMPITVAPTEKYKE
ncbi:energy transducer TonB [Flavobacterium gilvum]|nr:energy transducer TonB [Flavobacterium gilvum]